MLNHKGYEIDELKKKCQKYEIDLMEMKNFQNHIN